MSKHTPGPWRVSEQCAQMIDIRHDNNEPGAISLTLAKVVARPSWQREAEANARLIAVAPELLDVLRIIADGFARGAIKSKLMLANADDESAETMPMLVGDIVRAAIAKATGA